MGCLPVKSSCGEFILNCSHVAMDGWEPHSEPETKCQKRLQHTILLVWVSTSFWGGDSPLILLGDQPA